MAVVADQVQLAFPSRQPPLEGMWTHGFRLGASFRTRVLPLPSCKIIFHCTSDSLQSSGLTEKASGLVAGMTPQVGQVRGSDIEGIEVQLSPLVAAAVLGVSPVELDESPIALDEVWGADAQRLRSRLVETRGWERRFALVHESLMQRCRENRTGDPEVADAWRRIRRSGGQVCVADLARDYGWSRTRFWSRFKNQVGVSPKRATRIVRFDRALRLISAGVDLAAVAAVSGYADQSHLNRDFLDLAAATPGELRADPSWTDEPAWLLDDPTLTG
ncbi:AraC family transcriptional regulator [Pseudonocardia sp. MH-G8]|nr:AraC family transcriptional regulator [Pseudonocardia sp. MH-G8]